MVHKCSSFVALLILFVASSSAIPAGDVNKICNQTKNPSFCLALLNSKPGADFVGLTEYIIDVARANITNTIELIKSLVAKSANDPKAKSHYESCLDHFSDDGALGDVDYTKELLKKGDYQGVNSAASAVIGDIDDCISGEDPSDPGYKDPSVLPKYAGTIDQVVGIILVISKYLGH